MFLGFNIFQKKFETELIQHVFNSWSNIRIASDKKIIQFSLLCW